MKSPNSFTPREIDAKLIASRRLLAECRHCPNPTNVVRMQAEVGLLKEISRRAPPEKAAKINRLITAYLQALPSFE